MVERIGPLMEHMRWADRRTLEALRAARTPPAAALEIYAHLLGAEHVWLARLRGRPTEVAVWPELDLEGCAELARRNEEGYRELLEGATEAELEREVAYVNSAGEPFRSRVGDVLLHVAMHGGYHRGQVALLLRQGGHEPAPTDFIAFVRGAPAATRRP